ncbi:MAG TPA: ergothioneine biosynthesis protein EgtB [Gemmatimonadaceae bacterium]|nr:ergothioneine biosynthesis protein EgtB [Gemmatimonadaceae bacterium]
MNTPDSILRSSICARLTEARERTLLLVAPLSDEDLRVQHDPLMSPILWDLGHIAHFEELWLTRNLSGHIEFSEMPGMYNPFEYPRATRAALPLPSLHSLIQTAAAIRADTLTALESADLQSTHPLLAGGFVYNMVLQHEYQHNETILQTLQLKGGEPYRAPRAITAPLSGSDAFDGMVHVNAGEYLVGTDDRSVAYDNERPQHAVRVNAFEIDAAPVTNAEYARFIADGGYRQLELWSEEGRAWLADSGAQAPKHWTASADGWMTRTMDMVGPVTPDHPVCHVCYYEADAYARWAGKRLPTEQEWEIAASWNPATSSSQRFPWGDAEPTALHANVDQLFFGTTPIGAFERNVSPLGCYGMIGDVWEWTSSDFTGHPGFVAYPYPEYSEAFFGTDYKVLRGGSWATRAGVIRNTFRNWDYPIRRQIFSGFRCARDV